MSDAVPSRASSRDGQPARSGAADDPADQCRRLYANNDAQRMAEYQAQLAQQNAQFGGLASLGSAVIGAGGNYLTGGTSGALSKLLGK